MTELTVFAPSAQSAERLAQRLLKPGVTIARIEETAVPASQQALRDFWTTVRRMTARTQSKHQRKSNPSSSGTLVDR